MIKNYFKLIIAMTLLNTGCSAQKDMLINSVSAADNKQPVEDSILVRLQTENDLVIAYAVENFAWVRSVDYRIITQNNNDWKGYIYHKNMMPGNTGSPTVITMADVDRAACDSLLNYITAIKAWNIKGDSEDGFCADRNKKCNINDAPGSSLWVITKSAAINPYYYAPDFFEKCCPDEQRGLFLSVTKKIAAIVGQRSETE